MLSDLNQSSAPPGVLGLAMEAGLKGLGMDSGPPPGGLGHGAGEVRDWLSDTADSWLAGEPAPLASLASLPTLEIEKYLQLLKNICCVGPDLEQLCEVRPGPALVPGPGPATELRGGMASPSSSKVVASISCSDLPARYICTRIHFFFRLGQHSVTLSRAKVQRGTTLTFILDKF